MTELNLHKIEKKILLSLVKHDKIDIETEHQHNLNWIM